MLIAQQILTEYTPNYSPPPPTGWSSSDIIASFAALISLFSIGFTYYSVYLSKELEIKYKKFESLGIETLHQLILPLDKVFEDNVDVEVVHYLKLITDCLVDIELFLIEFTDLYSKLEITKISDLKDEFSDYVYANSNVSVKLLKVKYLAFKTKMFYELYDFAMMDDIGFWNRILRIKKKILSW